MLAISLPLLQRIRNSTALELLSNLDEGSVGAVITDPPFFIGIGRHDGAAGNDPWVGEAVSTVDQMVGWSTPIAEQTYRALRPGGAAVTMGGAQSIAAWEIAAIRAGLAWMADLTVLWNTGKPRARNFGSLTMTIRWHSKPGARHAFNSGAQRSIYSNVLVCTKVPPSERRHPAQKPVELTNFLVSLLTVDGDIVVDPFCGSGSTLVSAAMCDRSFIGGDVDLDQCNIAAERVSDIGEEESRLRALYLWTNNRLYPVEG